MKKLLFTWLLVSGYGSLQIQGSSIKDDDLKNKSSFYPQFTWQGNEKTFNKRQKLIQDIVAKIPSFHDQANGNIDGTHYDVRVDPSNEGTFGSVAFVGLVKGSELIPHFAVKIFKEQISEELQIREIKNLALCNPCPDIIDFYGAFKRDKDWLIVMEKAEKSFTSNFNKDEDFMDPQKHFLQICRAFAFIHQKGYLYLDPKPENILLDENENARLADLGIMMPDNILHIHKAGMTPNYSSMKIMGGFGYLFSRKKILEYLNKPENSKVKEEVEKRLKGTKLTIDVPQLDSIIAKLKEELMTEVLGHLNKPENSELKEEVIKILVDMKIISSVTSDLTVNHLTFLNLSEMERSLKIQLKKKALRDFFIYAETLTASVQKLLQNDNEYKDEMEALKILYKDTKNEDFKFVLNPDLHAQDIEGLGIVFAQQILCKRLGGVGNYQEKVTEIMKELEGLPRISTFSMHLQKLLNKEDPLERIVYDMLGLPTPSMEEIVKRFESLGDSGDEDSGREVVIGLFLFGVLLAGFVMYKKRKDKKMSSHNRFKNKHLLERNKKGGGISASL